jgi:phage replication O-like protein O
MGTLSGSENLIFLAIMRKTFGWQKVKDKISYTQIEKVTGIGSYSTIKKAISSLEEKGFIIAEKTGKCISYEVNIETTTETVDIENKNDYRNCSDTITETVAIIPKTTTETVDTKESNINKSLKEIYIEIETAYLDAFKIVLPNKEPILDYGAIRKRQKIVLSKLTKDKVLFAIERAKYDEWIVQNGFSLMTILGDYQLNKLINGNQKANAGYSKPELKVNQRTTMLDLEE